MDRIVAVAILVFLGACTAAQPNPDVTASSIAAPSTNESSSSTGGTSTIDPAECPQIGPERTGTRVGPMFVCDRPADVGPVYGGLLVHRSNVTTAEEAVFAWLAGPTEGEQAAGLQGWDLRPYPWFAESLTFRREGTTLVMEVGQWEPINNLSTSNGSAVFKTTLFGTVFSDPTVEEFKLSILGDSCPVMIGESEWCFPIDWNDFVDSLG